jgi:hypothetical protein
VEISPSPWNSRFLTEFRQFVNRFLCQANLIYLFLTSNEIKNAQVFWI